MNFMNFIHPMALLFSRLICSIIIQRANSIYEKHSRKGIDTILFFLVNPKYIRIYEPAFSVMKRSTKYRVKIIIAGRRRSFHLDAVNKYFLKKYDVIYFPNDKIYGISCDYLITNTVQNIGQIRNGQIIHLPHLTTEAMHYFTLLFEDAMYCDGVPLSNKINHVVYTYNTQGPMCSLRTAQHKDLHVVFFSQIPMLWQCAESVYEEMLNDRRCDVSVIQLPFYHANNQQTEDIGSFLRKKKIPFKDWNNYDVIWEAPDVIIFLSPYDSTRPEGYKFEELYKVIPKTVYIPYALGVSGGYIINYNFREPIQIFGWKIYARSQRYYEMFKKNCPGDAQNVVVSGHPKMDLIYNLDSHSVPNRLLHKIKGRKVILWNPHHTLKKDEWSTFEEWNDTILDKLSMRNDLFLIVRPHPLLYKNIAALPNGERILDHFLNRVRKMENVFIDQSNYYLDVFKVSDGLISDASSLLLEYLPTKKPILYTCKIGGGPLNDDGNELIQYLYQGITKNHIDNFIDMVAMGKDIMYQIRTSQIVKFLYIMDGKAGRRIKDDIINSCIGDRLSC